MEVKVGAIVLSPGYEAFDPKLRGDYGYGKMENVVTSLDFERLLCATGPHEGDVLRPSDKKHPIKSPGFSASVPDRLSRAATAIVLPYAAPIPRSR